MGDGIIPGILPCTMQHADVLSQPVRIGPLTAPNRIVMPPLVIWKADETGMVTDYHVAHYRRSAGPGLIVVEATAIAPEGRLAATQLGAWSDDQIVGLSRLARVIADAGGLPGIQLHHAGGSTSLKNTCGLPPRVPSLVRGSPDAATEMSAKDIEHTIASFAHAARRALDAGFRVIELHGAHGYLISQFLSPDTNRRPDRWGGSPDSRRSFLLEALRSVRHEISRAGRADSAALTVRLGLAASPPSSLSLEEGCVAAIAAEQAGADLLDVSHGGPIDDELASQIAASFAANFAAKGSGRADEADGWSSTLRLAAIAKTAVSVPVIGVGGIRTPAHAARAVIAGIADLVAVGRGTLADPAWARKALGLDERPIEPCRHCEPHCYWFKEAPRCPARKRLATKGEQEPVA